MLTPVLWIRIRIRIGSVFRFKDSTDIDCMTLDPVLGIRIHNTGTYYPYIKNDDMRAQNGHYCVVFMLVHTAQHTLVHFQWRGKNKIYLTEGRHAGNSFHVKYTVEPSADQDP